MEYLAEIRYCRQAMPDEALASARMGFSTVVFAINLTASQTCPAILVSSTAKSHLVFEIDALAGDGGRQDHDTGRCYK